MTEYLLAKDAFVCFANEYAVFLDLQGDKYSALEPVDAQRLRNVVRGWPGSERQAETRPCSDSTAEIVRSLQDAGLLTTSASTGKTAKPVSIRSAITSAAWCGKPLPRIKGSDLLKFTYAWLATTVLLRVMPLKHVIARSLRRKQFQLRNGHAFDSEKARHLAVIYSMLQPSFFSSDDACLRNSLTFVEFVSQYGLYPTCVFGVQVNPFRAHAWVQEDFIVLNDRIETIAAFVPIMTI